MIPRYVAFLIGVLRSLPEISHLLSAVSFKVETLEILSVKNFCSSADFIDFVLLFKAILEAEVRVLYDFFD